MEHDPKEENEDKISFSYNSTWMEISVCNA
jgi:hypothetical protein